MNAMEQMMLSVMGKLTGLTPDQMQELANNAVGLLKTLDERMANIERMVAEIHARGTPIVEARLLESKTHDETHPN